MLLDRSESAALSGSESGVRLPSRHVGIASGLLPQRGVGALLPFSVPSALPWLNLLEEFACSTDGPIPDPGRHLHPSCNRPAPPVQCRATRGEGCAEISAHGSLRGERDEEPAGELKITAGPAAPAPRAARRHHPRAQSAPRPTPSAPRRPTAWKRTRDGSPIARRRQIPELSK